ncbi:hypothetical protein D9757_006229 [Collybiopsis confluens]|uniref:TMEM205-like domain-containing protein n=1 Tax=Collybiopsis confluens TaxID=2823264 RepID=A0A8H5HJW3_9AGAR|nr:hypothetical protein D9757_006229 [Collybiopsis confluens]
MSNCNYPSSLITPAMSKVEELTLSSVLSLFSANGLYTILYSWLFGMSVWITFFGGIIAFKTLPRQQFGNLQHKTFPIYFVLSISIVSSLLVLWTFSHPDVLTYYDRPLVADVSQFYLLISVLMSQGTNYFVIGPMTSKTMFERHRLEKEEGKVYNEPGVSDAMKALNKRFGALHGVSSLFNLWSVIAIAMHGLYIGN